MGRLNDNFLFSKRFHSRQAPVETHSRGVLNGNLVGSVASILFLIFEGIVQHSPLYRRNDIA